VLAASRGKGVGRSRRSRVARSPCLSIVQFTWSRLPHRLLDPPIGLGLATPELVSLPPLEYSIAWCHCSSAAICSGIRRRACQQSFASDPVCHQNGKSQESPHRVQLLSEVRLSIIGVHILHTTCSLSSSLVPSTVQSHTHAVLQKPLLTASGTIYLTTPKQNLPHVHAFHLVVHDAATL
jgi:hypothetical protein